MKQSFAFFLLLFIYFSYQGQVKYYDYVDYDGDTIQLEVIESPTICDCINKDYRNKDQITICNRVYDYDFMSEEEKKEFDDQAAICRYPSVCDCALADMNNKGLIKACDRQFNKKSLSTQRKKEIREEMNDCVEKANGNNLEVCDCINVSNNAIKRQCEEKYFDPDFSEEKKQEISDAMRLCVTEENYAFQVSICDCALYGESDPTYKKACSEQYVVEKMDSLELLNFNKETEFCKNTYIIDNYIDSLYLPEDSVHLSVCECIDVKEYDIDKQKACLEQWNFKDMSPEEITAYKGLVASCSEGFTYGNEVDICLCMFKIHTIDDPALKKKCERFLESLSDTDMQEYFSNGFDCFED